MKSNCIPTRLRANQNRPLRLPGNRYRAGRADQRPDQTADERQGDGFDQELPDWDRVLAINITGQFNCVRLAVPHLRKSRNPSIINLSSIAGRLGMARRSAYSASKWAVIGFTKSLSVELGSAGIRVNSVLPGLVEGDRLRRVIEANAKTRGIDVAAAEAEFLSYVAMKKTVTPREIADAILFLCSPRGRRISGQAVSVCGDVQMLF